MPLYSDEDDASDVTDLDDDEDYNAKSKGKRKASKQTGQGAAAGAVAYRIKNALKVPRATTYTAQALYDQIQNGDINLEPEYQRDVVWPETKQIGLIDSVFRNFYIPPVIFVVNSYEDGSETKTCIDGKQRLTSIYRFMDGLIPHKDSETSEKLWYKDLSTAQTPKIGRPRRLLPDKYRRLFANKQVVCVEYQDITDGDEREIFQRVQLGMALTPAEKLQVINSSRASFIRELQSHFLHSDPSSDNVNSGAGALASSHLDWDRNRGADFRCLSQSVFLMDKYTPNMKNAGTIVQLEKWLNLIGDVDEGFKKRVFKAFELFAEMVLRDDVNSVFKTAKISPLEFIAISLLIARHGQVDMGGGNENGKRTNLGGTGEGLSLTVPQLARAIGKMRQQLRQGHVDVRMNNRVAKTVLDFIHELTMDQLEETTAANGTPSTGKRARGSDEDVEPPPAKSKTKKTNAELTPPVSAGSGPSTVPHTSTALASSSASTSASTLGASVAIPPPGLKLPMERIASMRATKAALEAEKAARLQTASVGAGGMGDGSPMLVISPTSLANQGIPGLGSFSAQHQTAQPHTHATAPPIQPIPLPPASSSFSSNVQMLPSPTNSSGGGRTPKSSASNTFAGAGSSVSGGSGTTASGHSGGNPAPSGGRSTAIPLPPPPSSASTSHPHSYQSVHYQGR